MACLKNEQIQYVTDLLDGDGEDANFIASVKTNSNLTSSFFMFVLLFKSIKTSTISRKAICISNIVEGRSMTIVIN